MNHEFLLWVVFNIFVIVLLVVDLKIFHRESHEVSIKEALLWTVFWIALALLFNVGIYFWAGTEPALEYLTGYLIEKSLSMDNLFVFLMIFSYFGVAPRYQHNVLFWGILGALIMRTLFIMAGITLITRFHWVIFVFGAFLVYTGIKLAFQQDEDIDPEKNPVLKLVRRFVPVTPNYIEQKFFVKQAGRWLATPLFVVLVVIETTDVIFALDSIPAILAITTDPFIVYSSNVFAILGLRALYFALAGIMRMFHYLHYGLSLILVFVGAKMLLSDFIHIRPLWALGVIGSILLISILASVLFAPPETPESSSTETDTEPRTPATTGNQMEPEQVR
ncbi:MAG: TerC family protein [Chloroflexi bacterium]|nr:MAG: TerC family protein [Chloroflexota bacterium]